MVKVKESPTVQQVADEFGVDYSSLCKGKAKGSEKYALYVEAWVFRQVQNYMPVVKLEDVKPSVLAREFNKTCSNMSALMSKGSDMYWLYVEVYQFRKFLRR